MDINALTKKDKEFKFTLSKLLNDTYTFTHEDGREIALQILPQPHGDGHLALYEIWAKGPAGRLRRLFTERGYEVIFELPLLLEHHIAKDGYPTENQELIKRFFDSMVDETFLLLPKTMFK